MRARPTLVPSDQRHGTLALGLLWILLAGCRTKAIDPQQFHRQVDGPGAGACGRVEPTPKWRCPGCSLRLAEPVELNLTSFAISEWLIDLDGDLHPDVVRVIDQTAPAPLLVEVRWGRGGSEFEDAIVIAAEGGCAAGSTQDDVVAGDFAGDGGDELVIACGRSLLVLSATPDRAISQRRVEPSGGWFFRHLRAAEMNGDCHLDLCGIGMLPPSPGYPRGHALPVCLLNDGRGSFADPRFPIEAGTDPLDLAIGDFDGNGSLDVAISQSDDNDRPAPAVILFNDGHGELGDPIALGFDTPPILRTADVNGDGREDLVAVGHMHIGRTYDLYGSSLINRGGGQLTQGPRFDGLCDEPGPIADLDGDGALDLGCRRFGGSPLLLGTGDGRFTPSPLLGDSTRQYWRVLAGDLDRDGRTDVLASEGPWDSVRLSIRLNRTE